MIRCKICGRILGDIGRGVDGNYTFDTCEKEGLLCKTNPEQLSKTILSFTDKELKQ